MQPRSQPVLLLGAIGAVLLLVIGLVRVLDGGPERTFTLPAWRPGDMRVPAGSPLRPPTTLPPLLEEPDVALEESTTAAPVHEPAPPATTSTLPVAHLGGLVLRGDGTPATGARVVLGKQHARCDPQGRFEMTVADPGGATDLLAFEPGSEPAVRPAFGASLAGGGEFNVRLVLGPETLALAGRVIDREGAGLKGWTVELDGTDLLSDFRLRERVRTDGEGRFEIPDVPVGTHVVRAWRERAEEALRSEPAAAGERGIVIQVR